MDSNLNPEEFGHLAFGARYRGDTPRPTGVFGEAQGDTGLYWSDAETQRGFAREVSHPDTRGGVGSERFGEFDSEWQDWSPETVHDSGKAMASYLAGYPHPSRRN